MKKNSYEIIFENSFFIAVNKPAGLLSIPDREQTQISLKEILQAKYGKVYTVHRLDKDTSGIIIFAKTLEAHKYYSLLFEERKIEKYYMGLVLGTPTTKQGTIDAPIAEHAIKKGYYIIHRNGKPSITEYNLIEEHKNFSLLQFQLHTGRTHQIRVHCKNIGHPLACDELYGNGKPILLSSIKKKFNLGKYEEEEKPMLNRLALHSYKLKFTDPDGKAIELCAELPKDISALLKQLKKNT